MNNRENIKRLGELINLGVMEEITTEALMKRLGHLQKDMLSEISESNQSNKVSTAKELFIKCKDCEGTGIVTGSSTESECCMEYLENGDCCGSSVPIQEPCQEQCGRCQATGFEQIDPSLLLASQKEVQGVSDEEIHNLTMIKFPIMQGGRSSGKLVDAMKRKAYSEGMKLMREKLQKQITN